MQSKSGTKSNKLDSGAPSHLSTCEFASTFRVQTPAPVLIQLYSGPPLTKSAKRHQVGKKKKNRFSDESEQGTLVKATKAP